jgi:azurin
MRKVFWSLALVTLSMVGCKRTAEINIATVGETMTYDQTAFTVKAGQTVHVVLSNHATSQAMKHNWVLVTAGKEATVATAGLAAGEGSGYVPRGDADVLAYTPLSQPGGQVDVTFTAPAAGTYPFICTFPAHYQTMHGTLTVTP